LLSVCVASVLRIYYLSIFVKAVDLTWVMGPVFIWSAIEPSLGIVSACLPHYGPLRQIVRSKLSSTFSSNKSGGPSSASAPWRSGGGQGSQKANSLFAYGGSRFNFGGDKMLKLVEADDEIGLTNRVTAGSVMGKAHSSGSGSEDNVNAIVVQSTFVQTTTPRGRP
jgi:hypothetical protein